MSKTFGVGDILVISNGGWKDYGVEQVVIATARFNWQSAIDSWKIDTKIDKLTARNFLKWLFDQRLIKKIHYEELYMGGYHDNWITLEKP